jgi:hypothetical protein
MNGILSQIEICDKCQRLLLDYATPEIERQNGHTATACFDLDGPAEQLFAI